MSLLGNATYVLTGSGGQWNHTIGEQGHYLIVTLNLNSTCEMHYSFELEIERPQTIPSIDILLVVTAVVGVVVVAIICTSQRVRR
jgi:hypothetical protein